MLVYGPRHKESHNIYPKDVMFLFFFLHRAHVFLPAATKKDAQSAISAFLHLRCVYQILNNKQQTRTD